MAKENENEANNNEIVNVGTLAKVVFNYIDAKEKELKNTDDKKNNYWLKAISAIFLLITGMVIGYNIEGFVTLLSENIDLIKIISIFFIVLFIGLYISKEFLFKWIFKRYADKVLDVAVPLKKSINSALTGDKENALLSGVDSALNYVSYSTQVNFRNLVFYGCMAIVGTLFTITQIQLFDSQNKMFNTQNEMFNKQIIAENIRGYETKKNKIYESLFKDVLNKENDRFMKINEYVNISFTIDSLSKIVKYPIFEQNYIFNGIVLDHSIMNDFITLNHYTLDGISAKAIEMNNSEMAWINLYDSNFSPINEEYTIFNNVSFDSTFVESTDFSNVYFERCSFNGFSFNDAEINMVEYIRKDNNGNIISTTKTHEKWFEDAVFDSCLDIDERIKIELIRMGALFTKEEIQERINELSKLNKSNTIDNLTIDTKIKILSRIKKRMD